jgi:hypothetical protein
MIETEKPRNPKPEPSLHMMLCDELARRCRTNPHYSMRAFARSLRISHSLLSMIMARKRAISQAAAKKILAGLSVDPVLSQKILSRLANNKSGRAKSGAETSWHNVDLDLFTVICDWYHYAILTLLSLPKAEFDRNWIARRLNITVTEAKLAMDRLQRLGLVEEKNGRWIQAVAPLRTDNTNSTAATRQFHKQLLQKALLSLEQDPFERRVFASMTMAVNKSCVPYARKRIDEMRDELTEELEAQSQTSTDVYELLVQFFPLTQEDQ